MRPIPPTRGERRRSTVAGLAAIAVGTLLVGGASVLPASAAELPGVIRDVDVTPTNPRLGTQVQTDIDWCVPNGTQAGDTFSLTLSEYLRTLPPGFSLNDPENDEVVATAVISTTDPAVVTFTMTEYAETHSNVCGTAFIRSGFDNGLTPGETVPFEFVSNDGTEFSTGITPGGGGGPVGDIDEAFKFGRLSVDQGHTDPNDAIQWYVVTPVGPLNRVVISDDPGAGMNIDCGSVDLLQGTRTETNIGGALTRPSIITPVACTADSVSVTVGPIPAGQAVRLGFRIDLDEATGPEAHEFANTANVVSTAPDGSVRTDNPSRTLVSSTGGGGGEGDNEPSVDIEKWSTADGATAGDFDIEPGKRVEVGTPIPVTMTIRNDGEEALTDVVVTDSTLSGPAMTGLTCDFSALGGPATGTTWDGPFAIGASFDCTGTVPAMDSGTLHTDLATVTGTGQGSGTGVTDDDPFNATTPPVPAIDIEKWATADGYPAGDFDTAPGKIVDADTATPITFTITNTGEEALEDVTIGDTTDAGPDITDLSCDFSPLGGPATGITWAGPFEVGDTFDCTAVVPGLAPGTLHSDRADVVGTGVVSGREVDDDDPLHVTTPEPSVDIEKWATEDGVTTGDFDDAPGKRVEAGTPVPVTMTITNDGDDDLLDVSVTDETTSGPAISGLSCDFSALGGPATGTTWEGPFRVGDAFACTGTVPAMESATLHSNTATVTGTGDYSGRTVDDEDPFNTSTPPVPAIDIEKWATVDGFPAGDFDELPGKAVDVDTPVDVTFTISNTGEEALADVTVGDTTDAGPDITDLSCDFSPLGGPATGTTWDGPFEIGDTFECTGTVPGMAIGGVHSDTADVAGVGVESGIEVDDEDPFHVTTPTPEPSIGIVKGDADGNPGDTPDDAVTLADGATGLRFTITNDGNEPLVDVVVSDRVVDGGTVTNLSCTFPDSSTGTTWDGPFAVGDAFDCTAELSGVAAGSEHHDVASVSGTGVVSGTTVTDDDPYHAKRPPVGGGGLAVTGADAALTLGGLAGGLLLVGAAVYLIGRRKASAV